MKYQTTFRHRRVTSNTYARLVGRTEPRKLQATKYDLGYHAGRAGGWEVWHFRLLTV
jgi:hypothetical protein